MSPFSRIRRPLLLLTACLILIGGPGCDLGGGSSNEATVSGRVFNAVSDPIGGAQVILQFTDGSGEEVEQTTSTDSTGRFAQTIEVEGATEVAITVSEQGASVRQTRQVSPDGGASDLRFTLDV
ncbi:MAG: hypothetical protein BRD25_04880, partial [Bacteroidetes bacterium QH_1_61_8]